MKIHEFDARAIFTRFGLPVTPNRLAPDAPAARAAAEELGCPVVVKAQVLVGGRGKAGGVKLAGSPEEAERTAREILGLTIKGLPVRKVLVARAVEIDREFYAGMLYDRVTRRPLMMVSPSGGVDIEEVARTAPDKILKLPVNPQGGLMPFQVRRLTAFLTGERAEAKQVGAALQALYTAFMEVDASLAEINPLVVSPGGKVWAIDAKINIDDNALERHAELQALRDTAGEDPGETQAREADLSFVKLDGTIGCIVNGAGLAMATMDMIKHYGSQPANFLDIGGSSSPDKVLAAMRIILRDERVKAILINIFGGITRCDDVAAGLIEAKRQLGLDVPLVVRLTGTNAEQARAMLAGTELIGAETMDEAVQSAIAAAQA